MGWQNNGVDYINATYYNVYVFLQIFCLITYLNINVNGWVECKLLLNPISYGTLKSNTIHAKLLNLMNLGLLMEFFRFSMMFVLCGPLVYACNSITVCTLY